MINIEIKDIIFLSFYFFIGISFGSFINNLGLRIVDKINIDNIKKYSLLDKINLLKLGNEPKYSVCPICENRLKWWMNLPLFSWIFLKGKCWYCQTKIPFIYFLSEFLFGIAFVLIGYFNNIENFITIILLDFVFIFLYLLFLIITNIKK